MAKNALRTGDHYRLNEVETNDLYDNAIHFAIESALCIYLAKEQNKALRKEFGVQETNRNLLQECLRLKAHVMKVENTMKETFESIDKLQVNLDEANSSKLALENQAKNIEDQVAILQRQV